VSKKYKNPGAPGSKTLYPKHPCYVILNMEIIAQIISYVITSCIGLERPKKN